VRAKYALNPTPKFRQINSMRGLLFQRGFSRQYKTPKKNFMPHFGFAYKVTEKTVLRGVWDFHDSSTSSAGMSLSTV
jgi:hypothetical protein